jgi:hypothetical protein
VISGLGKKWKVPFSSYFQKQKYRQLFAEMFAKVNRSWWMCYRKCLKKLAEVSGLAISGQATVKNLWISGK